MEQMLLIAQGHAKSQGIYSTNKKTGMHLHERNKILKVDACLITNETITTAKQSNYDAE